MANILNGQTPNLNQQLQRMPNIIIIIQYHLGTLVIARWPEKKKRRASLVVQWLRIHLLMQGTRIRALVQEDPTCRGAAKPVRHNYWACTVEPTSHNCWSPCAWSLCSTKGEATAMRSPCTAMKSSPHSPQLEKACMQQRRPNATKNKLIK